MSRVVPKGRSDALAYYEQHLPGWIEHREELDLDPELLAQLAAAIAGEKQATVDQAALNLARRSVTVRRNRHHKDVCRLGGAALQKIRAAGQHGRKRAIYSAASIAPPKKAAPIEAPGKPTDFSVELDAIGAITLKWTCDNKGGEGTMYEVYRRIGLEAGTPFEIVTITGEKKFRDETIPVGCAGVVYRVQAMRSKKKGPVATFNVPFGSGDSMRGPFPGAMPPPAPTGPVETVIVRPAVAAA
jgi:hypothetical protein